MVALMTMIGYGVGPLLFAGASHGHGYISNPAARNIDDNCRQCLSAGGPAVVNANGQYRRGMCGNVATDAVQSWNVPGPIKATYTEGQAIDIEAVITAHHLGYFDLQLCPSQAISDECFSAHRLMRAGCTNTNDRNCFRAWKTVADYEQGSWVVKSSNYSGEYTNGGTTTYKMRFQLPKGVTCSHCVLRWHYYTTNSCNPTNPNDNPAQISEEFFNCADISIVPANGAAPPSTAATPKQIADLKANVPRDLRPLGMGYQCPETAMGHDRDYHPPTSMTCWAPGSSHCDIVTNGSSLPPPATTTRSSVASSTSTTSITSSPSIPSTSCGTCTGCMWLQYNACYSTWPQATCSQYAGEGYMWCGGSIATSTTSTSPTAPPSSTASSASTATPSAGCRCKAVTSQVTDAWCQQGEGAGDAMAMCKSYPGFCAEHC